MKTKTALRAHRKSQREQIAKAGGMDPEGCLCYSLTFTNATTVQHGNRTYHFTRDNRLFSYSHVAP